MNTMWGTLRQQIRGDGGPTLHQDDPPPTSDQLIEDPGPLQPPGFAGPDGYEISGFDRIASTLCPEHNRARRQFPLPERPRSGENHR